MRIDCLISGPQGCGKSKMATVITALAKLAGAEVRITESQKWPPYRGSPHRAPPIPTAKIDQTGVEDMPSMTVDEAMSIVVAFANGPGGGMVIESNDLLPR